MIDHGDRDDSNGSILPQAPQRVTHLYHWLLKTSGFETLVYQLDEEMDGWMDGGVQGWREGWRDRCMNGWKEGQKERLEEER